MKKAEIKNLGDTELFMAFHDCTVQVVKEMNSVRGETKKTMNEFQMLADECAKRFNLEKSKMIFR